MLDLANIQATALRGYRAQASTLVFLEIVDAEAARGWLGSVVASVATAAPWSTPPATSLSIAITARGLRRLGLDEDSLHSFPAAFVSGMAARAATIGDRDGNAPAHWDVGNQPDRLHLVLHLVANAAAARDAAHAALMASSDGLVETWRADAEALPGGREHFGHADNIAAVQIAELAPNPADSRNPAVRAGAFVLGQAGEYAVPETVPRPDWLGRDGSFLVVRKLRQHVHSLRCYLAAQATADEPADLLAAKLVGRWSSGAPLALAPMADAPSLALSNDFGFADDPDGLGCPVGAHIRRVNPRDGGDGLGTHVPGHLMQRRGLPYGPPLPIEATADDGADRGILLCAVVGSIERQFEFVCREWLGGSAGLAGKPAEEGDPLVGPPAVPRVIGFRRTGKRPRRLVGLPDFVSVKGGEYCFLPSISALRVIASGDWA